MDTNIIGFFGKGSQEEPHEKRDNCFWTVVKELA
jgi:hypothetical protein